MAISGADLPRIIVERLEAYHPARAIFSADEIVDWPDGALICFETAGLLRSAARAEFVACEGCHWGCLKQVAFRRANARARAFIVCDEEPGLGRVDVPLDRLQQYQSTLNVVAQFMRDVLGIAGRAPLSGPTPLLLGDVKGRHGNPCVSLLLQDGRIVLRVGAHSGLLTEFLSFRDGKMVCDGTLLRKLANRKHEADVTRPRYQSDRTKQRNRAQSTVRRDRAILAEAIRIHGTTGKSISQISHQLARSGRFRETGDGPQQPLGQQRIHRIIYEQRKKLGANFSAQSTDPQITE